MQELSLRLDRNTHITHVGVEQLGLNLKKINTLEKLDLSFNHIILLDKGVSILSESLGKFKDIKELSI